MPSARTLRLGLCAAFLSACNSAPALREPAQTTATSPTAFTQEDFSELRTASCPAPDAFVTPEPISLTATAITPDTMKGADLTGLTFAGGWHLTSEDPNFGGLSGLTIHPKNHLLAISDAGAFVWISMLKDVPSGFAAISYMQSKTGQYIHGKEDADSEGLELIDGLALVSFERNHRILAFDLANCGAAANGVLVTRIPERTNALVRSIPDNQGAEALVFDGTNHLIAGLEMQVRQGAPIVALGSDGTGIWQNLPSPADKRLVGLDEIAGTTFVLYRNYLPLLGNQIEIHARADFNSPPETLAILKRPFPVDNFEGITATRLPDGTVRLYIISDDNFSDRQRTLLLAFDVLPDPSAN